MDPDELRAELHERWERSAGGWARRAGEVRAFGMPVARWLIDAVAPQPGQRLLELAAGTGDVGLLAAELVAPSGSVVISDFSEEMRRAARERAAELGISNVEFAEIALEWIDLPAASVDGLICRWGLMFAVDPEAALREARRVLRPGGRIALAVWDAPEHNRWTALPTEALALEESAPDEGPGMFALADRGRLRTLLEDTGFTDVVVDAVAVERRARDAAELWDSAMDLSQPFARAVAGLGPEERAAAQARLAAAAARYALADGEIAIPGRSLVAAATA
jgi:ubiquinone/menaquinone biosynthesis C-methylase UbiE